MQKLRKAIIPAAGLGTRFLPITKAIPKPMLSVLDKPTIQYIAEELNSIGVEEIIIVVSPDSDVIIKHFTKNDLLEQRLLEDGKTALYDFVKEQYFSDIRKYRLEICQKSICLISILFAVFPSYNYALFTHYSRTIHAQYSHYSDTLQPRI